MNINRNEPTVVTLGEGAATGDTSNLRAYRVSSGGSIVETAQFDGRQARLKPAAESEKIYIGPALPDDLPQNKASERTLAAIGAYQTLKDIAGNTAITVSRLPESVFQWPKFSFCHVTGHVNKKFIINGETTNLPVCNARVHICNVERLFLIPIYLQPNFRIPEWVLNELKYKLATLQQPVIKVPPPDPPPYRREAVQKTNLSLRSLTTRANAVKKTSASRLQAIPEEAMNELQSATVENLSESLSKYHDWLHPYLCLWPVFWPWFYRVEEEAIVYTDCNGHFDAWLFKANASATENIYIWIEVNINGQWVTVYRPPYPCYTRWNYACGTDITISVTDSRVQPCVCGSEGPGDAFWFRSVGNAAGALHIEQNPANTRNVQGVAFKNAGCTDILKPDYISPFGSVLDLVVFAGENIYSSGTGVTHFRWKATRIANENMVSLSPAEQTITILNAADKISREYIVHLDTFHYHSFNLDIAPSGAGDQIAFRIPNQNIALEGSITAAFPGKVPGVDILWRDIFWTGGSIDSHSLTDGLYRFDLELGTYDGAGNFIVTEVNPNTFQISESGNLDNSQDPTSPYLNMSGAMAKNFTMIVRIDNTPCYADIQDAELETGEKSGDCGFIKYADTSQDVTLSFEASHPRNFAEFSYSVIKGNHSSGVTIAVSGYVNASVSPFSLSAGQFSADVPVATLLGTCPGQAAFAENLSVTSLATDGSRQLYEYDRSDVNAFALSNV